MVVLYFLSRPEQKDSHYGFLWDENMELSQIQGKGKGKREGSQRAVKQGGEDR